MVGWRRLFRGPLALLLAGSPLCVHEEWNNLHLSYSALSEYVYPFDGRDPKIAVVLLNYHETTSPEVVVTLAVNGHATALVDRATGNFLWPVPGVEASSFGQVRKLRFIPDSQFIYCGSGDSQLRKLRVSDGAIVWKVFAGGWPWINGLDLTPDGAWLVAGTRSMDAILIPSGCETIAGVTLLAQRRYGRARQ
ncbi:MAG: hypothetical protein ABIR80_21660 [Opitutaceae bacterium]